MNNLFNVFNSGSASWVRYGEYVYRYGKDGKLYIKAEQESKPSIYNPLAEAEAMVTDAVDVGRLCMNNAGEKQLQEAVMGFVSKYGLMGFMTALPTTADFMDYDAVYLPKNHFIKEETMTTQDYVALYFPFDKLDYYKDRRRAQFQAGGWTRGEKYGAGLAMVFSDEPMALNMSLQANYAERFDWLVTQFQDLAFWMVSSFLYYTDKDVAAQSTLDLYRKGMSAFGGIAPTYRILLYDDGPKIMWDFHSLLRGVQMMFSFALTDKENPLRLCANCEKAFVADNPNGRFCGSDCEKKYGKREKNRDK